MEQRYASLLVAAAMSLPMATAFADTNWPTRTVQVVVPANPGGDTDFNARTMAKYFERITGRSMVITNMAGGGGTIATTHVRDAAADGNVMLFAHTGQLIVNEVSGLIDYSFEDYALCCIPGVDKGAVFVAGKRAGVSAADELIAKAKGNPGSVIYGTELGGFSHLQGLIFENLAGIKLRFVDTGPVADRIAWMLGGRIDIGAFSYGAIQDYASTGQMTVLGQPNAERNPLLAEFPTFREAGVDFVMDKPYIIAFPKGTDPAIVARMASVMEQITELPEYAKDLEQGFKQPVSYYDTEAATTHLRAIREDYMQYRDLLRNAR